MLRRGGIIRIGAVQRTRAIEIVRVQAPLVIGITEDAGSGQVRTEGHAVHALAITVGTDRAQHVGAMVGVAEAIGLACRDQSCGQRGGNTGA
ncbi:hypothetical protein G6F55_013745 [Rhizopus delemar]|nr:hypothetical protein G6F55_013745 [Rhizopus delemar]